MDPTYQQTMIQALMGQNSAAPGTTGQNASTPWGQNFMTGNMMNVAGAQNTYGGQNTAANQGQSGTPTMNSSNLTNGPSTQLLQPYSTY